MNRRGFLASCLALGAAPAVVRAASLMPWTPTASGLALPTLWKPAADQIIRGHWRVVGVSNAGFRIVTNIVDPEGASTLREILLTHAGSRELLEVGDLVRLG